MKFNFLSKKDKQVSSKTPDEYVENDDYPDPSPTPTTSRGMRPQTTQSNRFGSNFFVGGKKKQYDDEEEYDDDDAYSDEEAYNLGDEDDEDEDFERKYRKEMRNLAKQVRPQRVDDNGKETQKILHETFDNFYEKESEVMINMIEESRDEIKNSMMELILEQQSLKDDLTRISNGKYGKNKKENVVSLSMYLRRKRGEAGLISEAYSASNADFNSQQHITDKMAVEKYVKKKERQKVAETNRLIREKTTADIENETKAILTKLQAVDMSKEKERERQMEKIKMKLKEKNAPQKNDQEVANEIMETYNDAKTAFERERQLQQERIRQRLNQAKDSEGRPLTGIERIGTSVNFEVRKHNKSVPQVDI